MPTESPATPSAATTVLNDPDPPDDEQIDSYALIQAVAKRPLRPVWLCVSPDFATRQGSNVLLLMGVVLFALGCDAFLLGHTTVATLSVSLGPLTVVVAARMGQLVRLEIGGGVAEFSQGDNTFEETGSDGARDTQMQLDPS